MTISAACRCLTQDLRNKLRRELRMVRFAKRHGIMKRFGPEDRKLLSEALAGAKRKLLGTGCPAHPPKPPKAGAAKPQSTRNGKAMKSHLSVRGSRVKFTVSCRVTA